MSAATEYYGYLLAQGYSQEQISKFASYANDANNGIISHNKAYRMAMDEGWNSAEGDGKFKEWVDKANEKGWIDQGLDIFGAMVAGGMFNKKDKTEDGGFYPPPPPRTSNTTLYILGGVTVIGIGIAIYFATKKK